MVIALGHLRTRFGTYGQFIYCFCNVFLLGNALSVFCRMAPRAVSRAQSVG